MDDTGQPDVLVQRLHSLAVKHGLTIKEMALKCGIPKSSLEGYMRLKDAKRPGIDAIVAIADAMAVSTDWLCGRSELLQLGEEERKRLAIGIFQQILSLLRDIEEAQSHQSDPVVKDGIIAGHTFDDYASRVMLHLVSKLNLFPAPDFDGFRIVNELLDETAN